MGWLAWGWHGVVMGLSWGSDRRKSLNFPFEKIAMGLASLEFLDEKTTMGLSSPKFWDEQATMGLTWG